jgi:hypothetical protein
MRVEPWHKFAALCSAVQHAIDVLQSLKTGAGSVPGLGTPLEDTDLGGQTRKHRLRRSERRVSAALIIIYAMHMYAIWCDHRLSVM